MNHLYITYKYIHIYTCVHRHMCRQKKLWNGILFLKKQMEHILAPLYKRVSLVQHLDWDLIRATQAANESETKTQVSGHPTSVLPALQLGTLKYKHTDFTVLQAYVQMPVSILPNQVNLGKRTFSKLQHFTVKWTN